MTKRLRLGTRGSALALAQSSAFARALESAHQGLSVETVVIKTSGDRFSAEINSGKRLEPVRPEANIKAMFVKEIETALLDGSVDFAVHSSKDLPAELPKGLTIAAFPVREDPRDALICGSACGGLDDLPRGARVATASARRAFQLALSRPDLVFVPVRGNVDTRLGKIASKEADAVVLAEAGLRRLGRRDLPRILLDPGIVVPAPGQGALAIETADSSEAQEIVGFLDDAQTRFEVGIERELLQRVGGGCTTPLGALARVQGEFLSLLAFWSDESGGSVKTFSKTGRADKASAASLLDEAVSELLAAS